MIKTCLHYLVRKTQQDVFPKHHIIQFNMLTATVATSVSCRPFTSHTPSPPLSALLCFDMLSCHSCVSAVCIWGNREEMCLLVLYITVLHLSVRHVFFSKLDYELIMQLHETIIWNMGLYEGPDVFNRYTILNIRLILKDGLIHSHHIKSTVEHRYWTHVKWHYKCTKILLQVNWNFIKRFLYIIDWCIPKVFFMNQTNMWYLESWNILNLIELNNT